MSVFLEKPNPGRDLGGLCECFVYEATRPQAVANLHMHQYFELLYCLSGSFELTAEQHSYRLGKGCAALIHPMVPHSTWSLEDGPNRYLVLKFMPESMYATGQQMYGLKYVFPYIHFNDQPASVYTAAQLEGSRMGELLEQILHERQQQNYGYEMALHAYITQVLLWFLRAWNCERNHGEIDERSLMRLQQAQAYIEAHLDNELRAEDVAAQLGMGLSTFSRFFADAAGTSFPAYVRGKRLNKAAVLLSQTQRSIADIAAETGFSSPSYLILCFRQQYGVTPAQFRKLYIAE